MKCLSYLRKQNNLSQWDLAEKIGISQQTISKYERGLLEPDFETLNFLADYFNVSIDYLLGRNETQNDAEQLEPEILLIQRAAKKMDPAQKNKMVKILKASFEELFEDNK